MASNLLFTVYCFNGVNAVLKVVSLNKNCQLQPSNSTEELNAQMENLDTMIDDLQALQHEFNASA